MWFQYKILDVFTRNAVSQSFQSISTPQTFQIFPDNGKTIMFSIHLNPSMSTPCVDILDGRPMDPFRPLELSLKCAYHFAIGTPCIAVFFW